MYWRCTSIKKLLSGAGPEYFYIIHRVGRTAPKSFWVQMTSCKFSTVAVNSKPLLRPSKLDCTLVTFKFNNRKITPKTTLIKHRCLFGVIFSVFFWLLHLNTTKILHYRRKPLQSSTTWTQNAQSTLDLFFTTIITQYAKILLLLHNIPKYYYYDTIF